MASRMAGSTAWMWFGTDCSICVISGPTLRAADSPLSGFRSRAITSRMACRAASGLVPFHDSMGSPPTLSSCRMTSVPLCSCPGSVEAPMRARSGPIARLCTWLPASGGAPLSSSASISRPPSTIAPDCPLALQSAAEAAALMRELSGGARWPTRLLWQLGMAASAAMTSKASIEISGSLAFSLHTRNTVSKTDCSHAVAVSASAFTTARRVSRTRCSTSSLELCSREPMPW
mmetsp:Transcript_33468/g.94746  ORF Transcript_33468/g.94746 Transcript_33468/m.94746 type:complete len:232 (+) Transcript_33468:664-1359(+)